MLAARIKQSLSRDSGLNVSSPSSQELPSTETFHESSEGEARSGCDR